MSERAQSASSQRQTSGHWELTVLMALTAGAILGWYLAAVLLVYPLIGVVRLPVYLGAAVAGAGLVSWGLTGYQRYRIRRGAHEITPESDPRLHETVASMSEELGMRPPGLYLVEAEQPNARAVGTRYNGAIVFHSGLYELLSEDELDAIVGHELAHLYYCDSLVTVASMHVERVIRRLAWVVATLVNLLVFAIVVVVAMLTGIEESDRQAARRARLHRFITRFCVGVAGLLVLIPRNGLSRYREFVADRTAARLLGRPEPMIWALETLETQPDSDERSPLNPVNGVETRLRLIYATHPSIQRRIAVLRAEFTAEQPAPTDPGPILGTTTTFGLTVAPAVIVLGYGLAGAAAVGWLTPATLVDGNLLGTALLTTGLLFVGGSLFAFPWAMLFAAGGRPLYGVVAVCSVVGVLVVGTVTAPLGVVAASPLAVVAGLQGLAVGRSI